VSAGGEVTFKPRDRVRHKEGWEGTIVGWPRAGLPYEGLVAVVRDSSAAVSHYNTANLTLISDCKENPLVLGEPACTHQGHLVTTQDKASEPWWFRVTMDTDDPRLLGEDENGDLFVPDRHHPGQWCARFNPRNPLHWRPWLRSRRTLRIAMIESEPHA
jgi:hypothetical protein